MANNPSWSEVTADANQERARQAGRQQALTARDALQRLHDQGVSGGHVGRWVEALQQRVNRPEATLAELGAAMTPPMTKDAYAGLLRRALRSAETTERG